MRSTRGARCTSVVMAAVLGAVSFLGGCESTSPKCCAAGPVICMEVLDGETILTTLDRDANQVWTTLRAALGEEVSSTICARREHRAIAEIDRACVTVAVKPYDRTRSTLEVSAEKFGFRDFELAKQVTSRILDALDP